MSKPNYQLLRRVGVSRLMATYGTMRGEFTDTALAALAGVALTTARRFLNKQVYAGTLERVKPRTYWRHP